VYWMLLLCMTCPTQLADKRDSYSTASTASQAKHSSASSGEWRMLHCSSGKTYIIADKVYTACIILGCTVAPVAPASSTNKVVKHAVSIPVRLGRPYPSVRHAGTPTRRSIRRIQDKIYKCGRSRRRRSREGEALFVFYVFPLETTKRALFAEWVCELSEKNQYNGTS